MVLPRNIANFVLQSSAAATGAAGGPGGMGGRGGDGASGGGTTNNRINMTVNHNGGTMDEARLTKMVSRELRRRNLG
jgi:hypothetical protein